jgi:CheY-like chemotaxis protein
MTDYRGRFPIVEVLTVTADVERAVASSETADRIAVAAKRAGMKSLWESGIAHVIRGESTLDELMRVVDVPADETKRQSGSQPQPQATTPPSTPPSGARGSGAAGIPDAGRQTPAGGVFAAPPDLSAHFDLLEEPPASRRSGPHGEAALKVLLVDDEDSLRRVLKDLLEREGYDVAEARDGVQALDQVDRVAPDIIVLDLNLPGLDGYGVLSHLRSRPATSGIPVIVLTAKGDEDNEVRVFELGADDFLAKPFRARALSARLEAVLGRRRR